MENGMKQHALKIEHEYFEAVANKSKPFEVRRDDRGFQKGDELFLVCYSKALSSYCNQDGKLHRSLITAPAITAKISYILTGGQFGIEPGYVVLGLKNIRAEYR